MREADGRERNHGCDPGMGRLLREAHGVHRRRPPAGSERRDPRRGQREHGAAARASRGRATCCGSTGASRWAPRGTPRWQRSRRRTLSSRTPTTGCSRGRCSFLAGALDESPELVAAVTRQLHWDPATGERSETGGAPRPVVYRIARFRRLLALCTLRFNIFPIVGCAAIRTDADAVERRIRRRQPRRGLGALLGARLARAGSASSAGPGACTPSRTARSGTGPTSAAPSRRSIEASASGSSPTPPCLAGLASLARSSRGCSAAISTGCSARVPTIPAPLPAPWMRPG